MMVFGGLSGLLLIVSEDEMTASATTRHVPDSYGTIQAAINAATPGDTIVVANGTYWGTVLINKDRITLKGNSTSDCILQHHDVGTHETSGFSAVIN